MTRQRLWRGLNQRHWQNVLLELGWPARAAYLMSRALVGDGALPSWNELALGLDVNADEDLREAAR